MEIPGQGSGLVTVPPEPGDETPPPVEVSSSGAAQGNEDGRLRPGAKRVTFPSDEDIVSGAVEPKDPWRHGNGGRGRWIPGLAPQGGGGGVVQGWDWASAEETRAEVPAADLGERHTHTHTPS